MCLGGPYPKRIYRRGGLTRGVFSFYKAASVIIGESEISARGRSNGVTPTTNVLTHTRKPRTRSADHPVRLANNSGPVRFIRDPLKHPVEIGSAQPTEKKKNPKGPSRFSTEIPSAFHFHRCSTVSQ